jgi:hypothetical protein
MSGYPYDPTKRNKRVRDALKILPPGFAREEVEKSVAALHVREVRRSQRVPRKAIQRVAAAHRRLINAVRAEPRLSESWQIRWLVGGRLPELEKRQSRLEKLTPPTQPMRDARMKRRAVEEAVYLLGLAKLPLTSTTNGKFVRLAEALSGQRGGFRHHCLDYIKNPYTLE